MAEVSYLHVDENGEDDNLDDVVVTFDSTPFWTHEFDCLDLYASDLDLPPTDLTLPPRTSTVNHQHRHQHHRSNGSRSQMFNDGVSDPESSSITNIELFDREFQANLVMDLFHQRVEQSLPDPNFGVIEANDDMGLNNLELDLSLGLGFSIDSHNDDDNNSGFMVADCGDEFFVSRRGSGAVSESGESSNSGWPDNYFMGGLRVVDIGSDLEEGRNEEYGLGNDSENDEVSSLRIRLDSFHLEDNRDVNNEDFEWEEVDDRIDEREVMNMFFEAEADDDASVIAVRGDEEVGVGERSQTLRNLEWEVLLNVHNFETNIEFRYDREGDGYFDHDEYTTADYEILFGQFAENENALIGRPPASKTVVENLAVVFLTKEDVENNNALCAVCKDEINVGESATQLPCSHRYHGDCIVQWLGIRNTCPICRYELATDDPDYERRRNQRAARA